MTNTNSLTAAVIKYLSCKGFKVWRSNNIAAPNRKFTGLRGMTDVSGFQMGTGRAIYVEIKSKKDSLSLYQIEFGINVLEGGAMWFETRDLSRLMQQIERIKDGVDDTVYKINQLGILKAKRHDLLIHKRKKKVA